MDGTDGFDFKVIEERAGRLGLVILWDLVQPAVLPDGRWDLAETVARNEREARLEYEWAGQDQADAGSEAYFPREMGLGARLAYGAAMFQNALRRMERARERLEAVERLSRVLGSLRRE